MNEYKNRWPVLEPGDIENACPTWNCLVFCATHTPEEITARERRYLRTDPQPMAEGGLMRGPTPPTPHRGSSATIAASRGGHCRAHRLKTERVFFHVTLVKLNE